MFAGTVVYKCDVISEKVPYGGTNIVGPGQKLCIIRSVYSGPLYLFLMSIYVKYFCLSLCSDYHKYYHKHDISAGLG